MSSNVTHMQMEATWAGVHAQMKIPDHNCPALAPVTAQAFSSLDPYNSVDYGSDWDTWVTGTGICGPMQG